MGGAFRLKLGGASVAAGGGGVVFGASVVCVHERQAAKIRARKILVEEKNP